MRVTETSLPGVLLIEPVVHRDGRGFFVETYHADRYREHGIAAPFVQDNHSRSIQGTLRGLHLQLQRPQGKLIHVIEGEIFDVAVDVRRGSAAFGRWVSVALSADNFRQVYVPPGFAHGFLRRQPDRAGRVQVHGFVRSGQRDGHCVERSGDRYRMANARAGAVGARQRASHAGGRCRPFAGSVTLRPISSAFGPPDLASLPVFRAIRLGMPLALTSGIAAGLITAGRRECWGSQISGGRGASQ
jgi:dTDP-4-dehydrorhamnose 3,5-epimerase